MDFPQHSHRLAELVMHLTGCSPRAAVDAVAAVAPHTSTITEDEALEVVARAIYSLRHLDLTENVDLRTPAARAEARTT
jgi:hypothetical protein